MLDVGSCMFPFSLSQVGVGKSILQTLLGFFMFGGVTFHPVNVIGHVMNIMGGIGYTFLKYSLLIAITITLTLTQTIKHFESILPPLPFTDCKTFQTKGGKQGQEYGGGGGGRRGGWEQTKKLRSRLLSV